MLPIFATLLPLVALLLSTSVKAQDKTVEAYPMWVTNDYNCVIGCLQIFDNTVTARPSPDTEVKANQCIIDTCHKETVGMNIYQAHYIIQMFYATGSIYEDPNMGTWGQGIPPDLQKPTEGNQQPQPSDAGSSQSGAAPPAAGATQPAGVSNAPVPAGGSKSSSIISSKPTGAANSTGAPGGGDQSGAGRLLPGLGLVPVAVAVIAIFAEAVAGRLA